MEETADVFGVGDLARNLCLNSYENLPANTLEDQTQVDSKPAGQPEHASLNQCQLIAANRPELVLWAPPAGGGDKVSE